MKLAPKVVLHCPDGLTARLDGLVEGFLNGGVVFVGVVGKDCALIEEVIDELVVGCGDRDYDLLTSSHPDESVEEVVRFAESLSGKYASLAIQIVTLK